MDAFGADIDPTGSGQRTAVAVAEVARRDQDDVDQVPDVEAATGEQLQDAQPGLADVEAIHPKLPRKMDNSRVVSHSELENKPGT